MPTPPSAAPRSSATHVYVGSTSASPTACRPLTCRYWKTIASARAFRRVRSARAPLTHVHTHARAHACTHVHTQAAAQLLINAYPAVGSAKIFDYDADTITALIDAGYRQVLWLNISASPRFSTTTPTPSRR